MEGKNNTKVEECETYLIVPTLVPNSPDEMLKLKTIELGVLINIQKEKVESDMNLSNVYMYSFTI